MSVSTPSISRTPHPPRSRSARATFWRGFGACVLGIAMAAVNASVDGLGIASIILGLIILAIGLTIVVRVNPLFGTWWTASEPKLRMNATAVIIEGDRVDLAVPWALFSGLEAEIHGATMAVWMIIDSDLRLPVPALERTRLTTRSAREAALADVRGRETKLRNEQARLASA